MTELNYQQRRYVTPLVTPYYHQGGDIGAVERGERPWSVLRPLRQHRAILKDMASHGGEGETWEASLELIPAGQGVAILKVGRVVEEG